MELVYSVLSRPFITESKSYCSNVALPITPIHIRIIMQYSKRVNPRIDAGAMQNNCLPCSMHQIWQLVPENKVLILDWNQIKIKEYTG